MSQSQAEIQSPSVNPEYPYSIWRDLPAGPMVHFRKPILNDKGQVTCHRLIASMAVEYNEADGSFDVGLARCRASDMPLKHRGLALAKERLARYRAVKAGAAPEDVVDRSRREQAKLLARTFRSKEELRAFIESRPFEGIYNEEDRQNARQQHRTRRG